MVLGVPCLTLREETERPITLTNRRNQIVGTEPDTIVGAALTVPKPRRNGSECLFGHRSGMATQQSAWSNC